MSSKKRKEVTLPFSTGKKPRDNLVRNQFSITRLANDKFEIICKHCQDQDGQSLFARYYMTVNVTKLRSHLLNKCPMIPEETKCLILDSSQGAKKARTLQCLQTFSENASFADENLQDIRRERMSEISKRHLSKEYQTKIVRPFGRIQRLSKHDARKIIGREVEVLVSRMEPLTRLLDPIVQSALIANNPAIISFLPLTKL